MIRKFVVIVVLILSACWLVAFNQSSNTNSYQTNYQLRIGALETAEKQLLETLAQTNLKDSQQVAQLDDAIVRTRLTMKAADFWLRYLEPLAYKQINAPLPVEWETEVFEKYEPPYKRVGAGLTLAYLHLHDDNPNTDTLKSLIQKALTATNIYTHDSITQRLTDYHHFYLCNRLFLLNLAAIYTTGFECPNTDKVITELNAMLHSTVSLYQSFNISFPNVALPQQYLDTFSALLKFVANQPKDITQFDHFHFVRNYINPLFRLNQQLIVQHKVVSKSLVDYALNKRATDIFDKRLYYGQNGKGVFLRVTDSLALAQINELGKQLFFDPILSGNNKRSCASCHKPDQCFTDTSVVSALQYNGYQRLARNTPSLLNTVHNHLLMADGKHYTLEQQAEDVMTNPHEMGSDAKKILEQVLSCNDYKLALWQLAKLTPSEPEPNIRHITSAIISYYSTFSFYEAPFDAAIKQSVVISDAAMRGYNLFMGKAQCGTCHFPPVFNGVKPPYVGSEFEVLGVPADTSYTRLSADTGRYVVNPAPEMFRAFRTGTVRNAARTAPYMHNGVISDMKQLIAFYNNGGGTGHGLNVPNQTLSADSLHLSSSEQQDLIAFINSLNEDIPIITKPATLPKSKNKQLNNRQPGGEY